MDTLKEHRRAFPSSITFQTVHSASPKSLPLFLSGFLALVVVFVLSVPGCGTPDEDSAPEDIEEATGLSEWELEHGLGPITEPVELEDEIDEEIAAVGEEAFQTKCESCHRMDARFVGPPLGNVLETRAPEYVMNFMMNPGQNVRDHPVGQQMLREYLVEMPFQNVDEEEARAILEYLRSEQE